MNFLKNNLWVIGLLIMVGCADQKPTAKVYQVESLGELIGGPAATGNIGDFVLENDKIRVLIQGRPGGGGTGSATGFGGNILDADLVRNQSKYLGGNGLDQLFEIGPIVNLKVPVPGCERDEECPFGMVCRGMVCANAEEHADIPREQATEADAPAKLPAFEIIEGESTNPESGVKLLIRGSAGDLIDALSLIGALVGIFDELIYLTTPGLTFETTYELRPGESFLRIESIAYPYGKGPDPEIIDMKGFEGSTGLLSILLGDLDSPCDPEDPTTCGEGESCVSVLGTYPVCQGEDTPVSGSFGAWLMLLGGKLSAFAPEVGFDPWHNLKQALARKIDFAANPGPFETLAGIGDKVSYAFFSSAQDMMIPLATPTFTVALSNAHHCPLSNKDCLVGNGVRMEGFLSVGEGDAASALAPYYALRNIPTGKVSGVVIDAYSGDPVTDVDVLIFKDPWGDEVSDEEANLRTYDALTRKTSESSKSISRPAGEVGVVTHMKTDVGMDQLIDGDFEGLVPVKKENQRFFAVARDGLRISQPFAFRLTEGQNASLALVLPSSGNLSVTTRDPSGLTIPAKITVGQCMPECARDEDCSERGKICDTARSLCVPPNGCTTDSDCDPDEVCFGATGNCGCAEGNFLPRELGGHWEIDGVIHTAYTDGSESLEMALPVGSYEVIVSRGVEYSIHREHIEVAGGTSSPVVARLDRVVDTTGYVSADFHVHSANSSDAGLPFPARVLSFIGEGVEFVSSSDHDVFTNYAPTIREHNWNKYITTQVGVETSPLMLAHLLGFPMRYDEDQPQNIPEHHPFDWAECVPQTVYTGEVVEWSLKGEGDHTVTATDGSFDFAFDLENGEKLFSHTFDKPGVYRFYSKSNPELMQGVILVKEEEVDESEEEEDEGSRPNFKFDVGDHYFTPGLVCQTRKADQIMADMRAAGSLTRDGEPDALVVLPHVYDYFNYYGLDPFQLDLSAGAFSLISLFSAENFSGGFDGIEVINGKSQDLIRLPTVAEIAAYNKELKVITSQLLDEEISYQKYLDALQVMGKTTIARLLARTPEEQDAFLKSEGGTDCSCLHLDECAVDAELMADEPCTGSSEYAGMAEHSMRMLNRGIYRPMLSNSDTHDLYDEEAGLPRNFVQSMTDKPFIIDADDINTAVREGRLVASYGPFVELFVEGKSIGERMELAEPGEVEVAVKVQSPLWFDVDRVEVYKNGAIIEVFRDCSEANEDDTCIELPNRNIVNLDVTFSAEVDDEAWFMVAAMGVKGKTLAPVYSSKPLPRFGFNESLNGFLNSLPVLSALASDSAKIPSTHPMLPYALTNPIWVSVGDNCYTPSEPLPAWIDCEEELKRGVLCPQACALEPEVDSEE